MAQTLNTVKDIASDLQSSWYFRVWALLWFVCALVAFSALIIFGEQQTNSQKDKDWKVWIEEPKKIEFPLFHIRIDTREKQRIASKTCTHGNTPLLTKNCEPVYGMILNQDECFAVDTSNIFALNDHEVDWTESHIRCNVTTTGFSDNDNNLLAWELEGSHVYPYGPNSYSSVWIAPNNRAWVLLKKAVADAHGKKATLWERTLVYHSSLSTPGFYHITTIVSSFRVDHFEERVLYTGWMSAADIGGFAFFLLIIHTIAMLIVGFVLDYDGKFLNLSKGSSHQQI